MQFNREIAIKASLALGGLSIGGAGGYFFAKHRLSRKYADLAQQEIDQVKEHYRTRLDDAEEALQELRVEEESVEGRDEAPEEDIDGTVLEEERRDYAKVITKNNYQPTKSSVTTTRVVEQTTVAPIESVLTSERDPEHPYPITVEEFMGAEVGYNSITLTYYSGDDTLSGEDEQPIRDIENTVGEENLKLFGSEGYSDPNTIYVRNERLSADFEVILHQSKYSVDVLGLDDEPLNPPTPKGRPPGSKSRPRNG